jgi:uncharacterized protein YjbI with pentapeptide repeats
MEFEIKNRFSGAQFTAEIDARDNDSASIKIGLAVKWAFKTGADLRDADLRGAYLRDADLRDAYLRGADLRGAYLRDADLRGADLRDADLRGAYLRGADLRGAYLRDADLGEQWIIQGPTRSDGYAFFLMRLKDEKEPMVRAGCRWFTLADARKHWNATHKDIQLGNESLDILIWLERAMNLRGLK